jgi:LL-diaminopimelate aminotransferase
MAGWRMGWVAGKKEYIEAILRVKSNMDSGMFLGLQHAAVEALKNDRDWFDELNTVYRRRSNAARQILDALSCSYSEKQSGLFIWARAPQQVTDVEKWVDEILYATKVFITPGFIFGESGKNHVRISLCAPVEKMEEALARIRRWKDSNTSIDHSTLHLKKVI